MKMLVRDVLRIFAGLGAGPVSYYVIMPQYYLNLSSLFTDTVDLIPAPVIKVIGL